MSEIEKLTELMSDGWNIHIECKGKGRTYEMTFEATAHKVPIEEMITEENIMCFYPIHAVGDSLEELLLNLKSNMKCFSNTSQ